MNPPLLSARDLMLRFGRIPALDGLAGVLVVGRLASRCTDALLHGHDEPSFG